MVGWSWKVGTITHTWGVTELLTWRFEVFFQETWGISPSNYGNFGADLCVSRSNFLFRIFWKGSFLSWLVCSRAAFSLLCAAFLVSTAREGNPGGSQRSNQPGLIPGEHYMRLKPPVSVEDLAARKILHRRIWETKSRNILSCWVLGDRDKTGKD